MKKIKTGIVGLGRLGMRHAENLALRINGAELTAICDMDKDKLNKAADRLGAKYKFTDFSDMLGLEELDAVAVVSPSGFHTRQIQSALEAGKHVFRKSPWGLPWKNAGRQRRVWKCIRTGSLCWDL